MVLTDSPPSPTDEHFLTQQGTAAPGKHPAESGRHVGRHTAEQQPPTGTYCGKRATGRLT